MSDPRAIATPALVLLLPTAYTTKNILVNVEESGVLATFNPKTVPDIGDLFHLTAGGGLQ